MFDCECLSWCRDNTDVVFRDKNGMPIFPSHHMRCPHYNDSLIDVWKVEYDGQSYYTEYEPEDDELEGCETVTKGKMHREVFDQLPEFEGF